MDHVLGMGAPGVVGTAMCIVLGGWLVGAGIHLYLVGLGFSLRGAALTVGIGLATAALSIQLGYFVVGNVLMPLIPVVLASLGYAIAVVVRASRGRAESRVSLLTLVPTASDGLSGLVTLIVLYPLIRHGLTYFTSFINDFPSYAASSEVWLSESKLVPDFLHKHPDGFGPYHVGRSEFEKPASTATFVFSRIVSGLPGYALLGPIAVVSVFLLIGNLAAAIQRVFRSRAITATAVALIPVTSIIPMSRLHDAQIGHAISVAFLAVFVHASLLLISASGRRQVWSGIALVGIVLAATVGSGATLILGAGISWGALLLWMAYQIRAAWWPTLTRLVAVGAVALLASLPAIDALERSVDSQTTGGAGYSIPVPSPLAAVGLQSSLNDVASTKLTLAAWVLVVALPVIGAILFARSRSCWATIGLVAALGANGMLIATKVGVTNYAMHKWEAVVIAVVAPYLLARLMMLIGPNLQRTATIGLLTLAGASANVSWNASAEVPAKVPIALLRLEDNDQLAALDLVNVNLNDIYENSIAPLALPSEQIVLVGNSYAAAAAPIGDQFVLDLATATAWGAEQVTPLDLDYVLATVDLTVQSDAPVLFGAEHPESARFLYGTWDSLDPTGVWTTQGVHRLAFDVPADLLGRDVEVVIRGARLVAPDQPGEVVIRLADFSDAELGRWMFDQTAPRDLHLSIAADSVAENNGRIVLRIVASQPLRGQNYDVPVSGAAGFLLQSLTITADE